MVAYNPKHPLKPSQQLRPETVAELAEALAEQHRVGGGPSARLSRAVRAASIEARERSLAPEALIIQLKAMADDASLPPIVDERDSRHVRVWIVSACLKAYFATDADATG